MQRYIVGGAVRDELLGLPVTDRDWVVVGATPDDLLAQGFEPVGKDFPVFLHPRTHEEYALARTERKSGQGYAGFVCYTDPDVTLEEDLARRDLTINAMARSEDGTLIDPYGGQLDLASRVFRHVSMAFTEDPVRILRLARFSARFSDFSIAPETAALMEAMVSVGEVDHLVAERVWQEMARGLMEATPSRLFTTLHTCGALVRIAPPLARLLDSPVGAATLARLDLAAQRNFPLTVRWATLLRDGDQANALSQALRAPVECRELAVLAQITHDALAELPATSADAQVDVLTQSDAFRRPERFELLLDACLLDQPDADRLRERWQRALTAARAVDAGAVARSCAQSSDIRAAVRHARIAAIAAACEG